VAGSEGCRSGDTERRIADRHIIACPGGDFCSLANAKSIPIAESIQRRFDDLDYLYDIGEININISGCINSCGHHHVGHIGILGVDKDGEEWYQVSLGGADGSSAGSERVAIGRIIGPSFKAEQMPDVVERLITPSCRCARTANALSIRLCALDCHRSKSAFIAKVRTRMNAAQR
jgi:sulfite reductase beta subunit-like hemoprotein